MTLFDAQCSWGAALGALKELGHMDTGKAYTLLQKARRLVTVYDGRIFIQYHKDTDSFYVQVC